MFWAVYLSWDIGLMNRFNNEFVFSRSSTTTECQLESGCKLNSSVLQTNNNKASTKLLSSPLSTSSSASSSPSAAASSSSSSSFGGNTHKKSSSEGTMGVASGVANGYTNTELSNQLQFQTKTISHACDSGVVLEDDDVGSTGGSSIISDDWPESSPSDEGDDGYIEIKSQIYTATPSTVPRSDVSSQNQK